MVHISEFITSHKIPDDLVRPIDDEDGVDDKRKTISRDSKNLKKVNLKLVHTDSKGYEGLDPKDDDGSDKFETKRQARVELENFSDTGVLEEDGVKKIDSQRATVNRQRDSIIPGVKVR